ncbi:MAG: glycosyltransferase family 4 protein [Lachnospiraceae bacterium]|nr:glycosyltransferase family 4 protein [Lachnospiraceae bacterium]
MKIVQLLPELNYGDAVGNDAVALHEAMCAAGYEAEIYAEKIDHRLTDRAFHTIDEFRDSEHLVVLYHLVLGNKMNYLVASLRAKVILIYHNITPLHYLYPEYSFADSYELRGFDDVRALRSKASAVFAVSEYNLKGLRRCGFTCPMEVLPILIRYEDYAADPAPAVMERYRDDPAAKVLFTGRVSPNKCFQDVMAGFAYYQKVIHADSKLFLVGKYAEDRPYYPALRAYADHLDAEGILFTGHIPFDEILAYYRCADVFVCMSEHEGFCVPLIEAMYFGVPIIAYDSSAIAETLGGTGILLSDKSPATVGEAIDLLLTDSALRRDIIEGQRQRLKDFDNEKIKDRFLELLRRYA